MNSLLCDNNTFALVVTYNPEIQVFELLDKLKQQFNKILVIDNNSSNKQSIIDYCLLEPNIIEFYGNDINVGLAKALNQGCQQGIKYGFSWVVTFDQDTFVLSNLFQIQKDVYLNYPNKELIGAIGSNYNKKIENFKTNLNYEEKDYLITSGTLYSLSLLSQLGMFREDLFIDNIDIEYSLRLSKNNKKSLLAKTVGMIHSPGDVISKNFLVFSLTSSNHNFIRRYYMSRNHFIIFKLYIFSHPYFIVKASYFFILSIFKVFLIENGRYKKIKFSFKGLLDGINYKLD